MNIKNKRIVLISRFPNDIDRPRGGVETATVGLARALIDAGATDLHVVTLEADRHEHEVTNYNGIQVHRLRRSRFPMLLDVFVGPTQRRLKKYLDELKPDILHFQETWGFGSFRYGKPVLFTVHGFDSLNLVTEKKSLWRLRAKLWSIAEAFALSKQNSIVSIAPYVRRMIEPHTSAPIHDIWNALDKDYFEITRSEKPGYLLFIGWINPRKNPLILVDIAAKLKSKHPNLLIELCGEEDDEAYALSIKQRIIELNVENHIKLVGRVGQLSVREKLSRASIMVLPSLQENAPMAIAEAMAARVPCVVANRCGMPDMVSQGETGYLCDPYDVDCLTKHIDSLLSDDNQRQRIGKSAHGASYSKFHPSSVARQTLKVYQDLLQNTP